MQNTLCSLGLAESNNGAFGVENLTCSGPILESHSPIDGGVLGSVKCATEREYEQVLSGGCETFSRWRTVPAPKRGEIIRQIAVALRANKDSLGRLITLETGKILPEGLGEVQEAIDIADFAVGLSRQLYGNTMHSERPSHRMYEQWHPLGVVGVISAFNFPMAVWAWNAMLAAVCGDVVVWKPSELTPLSAIAINGICQKVATAHGFPGLFSLVIGENSKLGERLAADRRVPLISATGSCRMGRAVGEVVARRLGRSLLELGGNNAVVILRDADLNLAIPSTVFGSVGTAGQRCTSTRRILIEREIEPDFVKRMLAAYAQIKIGDPLQSGTLMGPLINDRAVQGYQNAISVAREQGGEVLCGGELVSGLPSSLYVQPTIVRAKRGMAIVQEETFAPILYVIAVQNLDEAIAANNEVPQGLSSSCLLYTSSSPRD